MYYYNPHLGIAGISDMRSGISAYTILQQPGTRRPSVSAYAGARYSRSSDSITDILEEIEDKNIDAATRLEKIFHSYGHASVAGMAHLFVCIENVPAITATRFFYLNPCQDGQERSTRYQDFSTPNFVKTFPVTLPTKLRIEFNDLLNSMLQEYSRLLPETQSLLASAFVIAEQDRQQGAALKARAFDCARHLLPLGMNTSFAAVMSARDWSRYISILRGSSQKVEQELGKLLFQLLTGTKELEEMGYVAEAAGLIRHADAKQDSEVTTSALISVLRDKLSKTNSTLLRNNATTVNYTTARNAVAEHVLMLMEPGARADLGLTNSLSEVFGRIVFSNHNQYSQIGSIAQHGAIQLKGFADLGTLKDLNRHRSLERFIPFLDNQVQLNVVNNNQFDLCAYLNEFRTLKPLAQKYLDSLNVTQRKINSWAKRAEEYLSQTELVELCRYLSPTARSVEYAIYGSEDDLQYTINTRVRPGGHINYRLKTYEWAKQLASTDRFWLGFLKALQKPDPLDREQFIDRS